MPKAAEGQQVASYKVFNALSSLWGYLKAASLEKCIALLEEVGVMCHMRWSIPDDVWKFFKSMTAVDPPQVKSMSVELLGHENVSGVKNTSHVSQNGY